MAIVIDGKAIAGVIRRELAEKVAEHCDRGGLRPGLAVILVGRDPASAVYVARKEKACAEVGFYSREYKLPEETTERELLAIIASLNIDPAIHGILVQLPLPRQIRPQAVIEAITPMKDVDGFHPFNIGRLFTGDSYHLSCTPKGIIELLDRSGIVLAGADVVIVGRSAIVGRPLALMMLNRHATVTVCHSKTRDLTNMTRRADILVAAVGQPELISPDMVREGAVVVDVGINRLPDGRLVGDVAYAGVAKKAAYITPVPGGVGPMTIAMLLENTFTAATLLTS